MFYVCEFEFIEDGGAMTALCLNDWGGATSGTDLEDAGECAADWLACMVDDCLMNGTPLPPVRLGNEPTQGGKVIAIAVSRELSDIPAMTAADAARELGVSSARVAQLINAGMLDSWKEGTRRMVSRASVQARLEDSPKTGRPKTAMV
ncbi:MAG: helix-turn-helix domain-containing protein [Coriobacteriia bacterium]|nr:helix-turn-helix domain-containing protein [Coriobacteriia bacterium]